VSAREEVLARIRSAVGPNPRAETVPRDYGRAAPHPAGSPALLELLTDRLEDYRATVHRTSGAGVADAVAAILTDRLGDRRTVLAAPGVAERVGITPDTGDLAPADLDRVDAVVTGCAVAIAETGTFVLDSSPVSGRRALTLVPDLHICIIDADQVVGSVPEAIARLDPARPLTFVSGPSATSDIELQRVEGVHGPRNLHVVLAADA